MHDKLFTVYAVMDTNEIVLKKLGNNREYHIRRNNPEVDVYYRNKDGSERLIAMDDDIFRVLKGMLELED